MGILNKIDSYFKARYDTKLERGLKRLNEKIKYNPIYNKVALKYMSSQRLTRKLTEYFIWYMGDEAILRDYYLKMNDNQNISETHDMNLFWAKAPSNYVMVHAGWPGLISRKKAEIIFGNGFNISVNVYKKTTNADGTVTITDKIDEKESDRIRLLLTDILIPKTQFMSLLPKMAEDDSWSGHTAIKFNFDRSITPYPIIESADARNFTIRKERGFTTAIIFQEWYNNPEKNKNYRRDEIYTTVRTKEELAYYQQWSIENKPISVGDAVIVYDLYEIKENQEILIPFNSWQSTCPELMNEIIQESYAFGGLQGMIAFEKPNRLPNHDLPGTNYGVSDYARNIVSFDKSDELYSENAREVRDNKAIRSIPASFLPKDSNGKLTGRNSFMTNVLKAEHDVDQAQGVTPEMGVAEVKDKTESILGKWRIEVGQICANVGLSPTSLGITGFESLLSSDKSQQEREKATIGTRKDQIGRWTPYLKEVLLKLLEFNSWLLDTYKDLKQPGIDKMEIDFENCTVNITFPDYLKASDSENITTWGNAKSLGVCDIDTAVEKIYRDLSPEEQRDIINRIKFEQGIASDSPEALRMETLLGTEEPPKRTGGEEE